MHFLHSRRLIRWYRYRRDRPEFNFVLDYLLEEVVEQQTAEMKAFCSGRRFQNGFWGRYATPSPEAIRHALAAQAWERAAVLIDRAAGGLLKEGQLVSVIGWFERLPDNVIRRRPDLGMSHVWALLPQGRLDEAAAWLAEFEKAGRSASYRLAETTSALRPMSWLPTQRLLL